MDQKVPQCTYRPPLEILSPVYFQLTKHMFMKISTRARIAALLVAAILLQACSNITRFEGATPGVTLALRTHGPIELPQEIDLASKATGQHEFKASSSNGQTMYGILPLKVNGKSMAASILLFAPALAIGGFRDPYAFYQIDPDAGVVRYKNKDDYEWRLFKPSNAESARTKQYFDTIEAKCANDKNKASCSASTSN